MFLSAKTPFFEDSLSPTEDRLSVLYIPKNDILFVPKNEVLYVPKNDVWTSCATMHFTKLFRSDDCIFNPVSKPRGRQGREEEKEYNVQLSPMQVGVMVMIMIILMIMMIMTMMKIMIMMLQLQMRKSTDHQHPEFVVESITTEGFR